MNQLSQPGSDVANSMQPIFDLISALNDSAEAIEVFISNQRNRDSPECRTLRAKEQAIVESANATLDLAAQEITQNISDAVGRLKSNIDAANTAVRRIDNTTKAISIASTLLAAAAGIASGGAIAAVPAILTLANAVSSAIN